jgi:hypothetical protein
LENPLLKDKIAQWNKEFSRLRSILILVDELSMKFAATRAELNTISAKRDALNAERNALSVERNALLHEKAQTTQALMEKEESMQKLKTELLAMYQSRSWRWTEPLRRLFNLLKQPK